MTTIGVKSATSDRILPMNIPSYSYHYPSLSTVKLAAVKEGLFHPNIPTFRRMDMDTAGHKLPDEHCRTTTSCGPEDFRRATTTLFTDPEKKLTTNGITETGRQLHRYYTTPEELKNTRLEWSDFLSTCPERYNIRLPELPQNKDLHFRGYAVRYLRPEITSSWKEISRPKAPSTHLGRNLHWTPTVRDQYQQMCMPDTETLILNIAGILLLRPGDKVFSYKNKPSGTVTY